MDAKTLEALRGSVKKWERIVMGEIADEGAENCPLCALFNDTDRMPRCSGCPVAEKTGSGGCFGSPYNDDWMAVADVDDFANTDDKREAAQKELDFLISLLPQALAEGTSAK